MRWNAGEVAELIRSKSQDVVQAGIRPIEIERAIQFTLLAKHTGRQLVGKATIPLCESGEVAIAGCVEGRA